MKRNAQEERVIKRNAQEKVTWQGGNMLYPVPVVMVSCARLDADPNIITVAWAGTVCSNPPMVSISVKKSRYSHDIIADTGEFVINLTTEKLSKATDYCGVASGRDVDKFAKMHLTPQEASKLSCPLIAESPVNIECRVTSCVELGSHDMFIANVEAVDVDRALLDDSGKLCLERAGLIAYSHGYYYGLGECLGRFGFSVAKKAGTGRGK